MSHSFSKSGHLTTAEAAALLDVSVATLKRWAQSGLLPSERTEGGHRRFRLEDVQALAAPPAPSDDTARRGAALVVRAADALALQSWLLEARRELGSWWGVAQRLRAVDAELHRLHADGELGAIELETSVDRLRCALTALSGMALPPPGAPVLLVGAIPGDHLLVGPALVQLAAGEAGWQAEWAGHPDAAALGQALRSRSVQAVIVCGSRGAPAAAVRGHAPELEALAAAAQVPLAFLGMADWPETGAPSARLDAVPDARGWLEAAAAGQAAARGTRPAPARPRAPARGAVDAAAADGELRWDPSLALGHAVVDAQHQTLFAHVAGFLAEVRRGEVAQDLPGLLAFTSDYARLHFRYEEELMRSTGYPALAEHRAEHEELARQLAALVGALGDPPALPEVERLATFLVAWLRGHVAGSDQRIAAHLRRRAAAPR